MSRLHKAGAWLAGNSPAAPRTVAAELGNGIAAVESCVTAVYVAEATGIPQAADDAKNLALFTLDNLPDELAFDHAQVLEDYRKFRETGEVAKLYNK